MKSSKMIASDNLAVNEAQLLLAEKRTALSVLRTGIAVFALPLSVLSVLIATSRYYNIAHVINLLIPLLMLNIALISLGSYLVIHAIRQIHRYDRLIENLKQQHGAIAEWID